MPTRTLSVDEEAYRTLVRAKKHDRESFSKVIKRARWEDGPKRCGHLLERAAGEMRDADLAALTKAQSADAPPPDRWNP